jgi:hypothetical protein
MMRYEFWLILVLVVALCAGCGGDSSGPSLTNGDAQEGETVPECVPECHDKECGSSGCPGYSCGFCGAGMFCSEDFKCNMGMCTAGTTRCEGDGFSTCAPDGMSWLEPEVCPEGTTCEKGECIDSGEGCTPGTTACLEGGMATCSDEGEWTEPEPCGTNEICQDGECVGKEQVCDPGEKKCLNGSVLECAADGMSWLEPQFCPPGTECQNGDCVPPQPKDCNTVLMCMLQSNCGDAQASCLDNCFADAADDAAGMARGVYDCVFDLCGKWGPSEPCFQTQQITGCASEFKSCQDDTCTPNCSGKDCGSDGCGGDCGKCPQGTTCQEHACLPEGSPCDGIGYEGCCEGQKLMWCEDGELKNQDCSWNPKCGWSTQKGYYDCGTQGNSDPDGMFPMNCDGGCTPNCGGKQCGPDGCGGFCGQCPAEQQCVDGICDEMGTGDGCSDIVFCALECNFSANCLAVCHQLGDQQAKQLFQNLVTCIGQVCGMMITQECLFDAIDNACKQVYNTCMLD